MQVGVIVKDEHCASEDYMVVVKYISTEDLQLVLSISDTLDPLYAKAIEDELFERKVFNTREEKIVKNEAIYIPFDLEMAGGCVPNSSLLEAHFAACDEDFNILDALHLHTKPNDGIYVVTAEALDVTKVDIIEHDARAITYSNAGGKLRDFIKKHSQDGKIKLIPMGKGIEGDIRKVNETILGGKTWNMYVSYRTYDITSLILFLKRAGKIQKNAPESLEGIADYLDIPFEMRPHTAIGDNLTAIKVVKALEEL